MPASGGALLKKCGGWRQKHLLGTKDFSRGEILQVLAVAQTLEKSPPGPLLKGKRVFNFFVEPSTRTKMSFGIAARALGAEVLDFSPGNSSLTKGESLKDTARTIESMGVEFAVMRHPSSGAPRFLSERLDASVINAGDGTNEHPTQALLDLFTIEEALGKTTGLKILLVGDIAHSRVARSNLWIHRILGNDVTVVGPSTMIPREIQDLGARVSYNLDAELPKHDVIMMLRLQLERQQAGLLPSPIEYTRLFGLTRERLPKLKKNAIIMHPGPMNRGLEISAEAADSAHSVILDQVANGVLIRQALLLLLSEARR